MKPTRKTGRHTERFLTHNENACKGRHCAECTPSTNIAQHRKTTATRPWSAIKTRIVDEASLACGPCERIRIARLDADA